MPLITFMGDTILKGQRNYTTKSLWQIDYPKTSDVSHSALATITAPSATPADLVSFAHAALFSPVPSTLQKVFRKKYITNLPGLTITTLNKHTPNSISTAKGHVNQQRQGIKSTKKETILPLLPEDDSFPASDTPNNRTNACYAAVIEPTTSKVFSDQTGKFIIPSSTGSNYLFLLCDYDSNSTHAEPMPSKSAKAHVNAHSKVHNQLVKAGLRLQLHTLDNECSNLLKQHITDNGSKIQTTPAGIHRRNATERAIQTFKNHLIAGLCSTDPHFPLHLWDQLIPQCTLTLNMLRGSRINPCLSAHAQVYGQYDFMATPIAPPGIHVAAHEKPHERGTWAPKGKDGWYIGPELEAHRCFKTWMWDTQRERKADKLTWFPTHLQMPHASKTDLAVAGVKDITQALQQPTNDPQCYPLTQREVPTLQDLSNIFTQRDAPALDPSKPPPEPIKQQSKTNDDAVLRANSTETPSATYSQASKYVPRKRRSERLKQSTKTTKQESANVAQATDQRILQQEAITWLQTIEMHDTNTTGRANKAINPDTGQLADYKELSQSSDGKY